MRLTLLETVTAIPTLTTETCAIVINARAVDIDSYHLPHAHGARAFSLVNIEGAKVDAVAFPSNACPPTESLRFFEAEKVSDEWWSLRFRLFHGCDRIRREVEIPIPLHDLSSLLHKGWIKWPFLASGIELVIPKSVAADAFLSGFFTIFSPSNR